MSDALKAAGRICERQGWNPDIIPELAKELEWYAAGLRTPERDAEIRREAIELCAKRIEDGYFLHDQAPTALFAKEAAKAIRSMT